MMFGWLLFYRNPHRPRFRLETHRQAKAEGLCLSERGAQDLAASASFARIIQELF
jgi:hypothetical protein